MKNYVQDGDKITISAAAAVTSGAGVLVDAMFGVATNDAAIGANLVLQTTGVVTLPKVGSQAWTVGRRIYWDLGNSRCTTVASGNTLIGVATEVVAGTATDVIGTVRLNGTF